MLVGQIIDCRTAQVSNSIEPFKIVKIGRKYIYLISDKYSSDGNWYIEKADNNPNPLAKRC